MIDVTKTLVDAADSGLHGALAEADLPRHDLSDSNGRFFRFEQIEAPADGVTHAPQPDRRVPTTAREQR